VLGIETAGSTDNFFEVGGGSLQALQLIWQIKERFGTLLPLSQLFEAPTIKTLAAVLRTTAGPSTVAPTVVPIQPAGSRPPLFCVHAVAGHVLCYHELARALGSDQPSFGIQSEPAAADATDSIEEMAARYVQAIRRIRPVGPCRLAGWSMGGLVAFEMARQLRQQGATIDYLALIDTPPPGRRADDATPLDAALSWEQQLVRQLGAPASTLHEPTLRRNVAAAERYSGGPYDGDLLIFRTDRRARREQAETNQTWNAFVQAEVKRWTVPGDHYGMLRQPHVAVLAELMTAAGLNRPA
jgi:thioesterase domain-containing protein/acyl carrier protein